VKRNVIGAAAAAARSAGAVYAVEVLAGDVLSASASAVLLPALFLSHDVSSRERARARRDATTADHG